MPFRQVHLDFHTAPEIRDVGVNFDARQFARTMKAAHVNSVTVFAKCHHGHLYYNTDDPARHPGLRPGHDLLREQIDALHAEGIRAPIYISVHCDQFAANNNPGWLARKDDSRNWGAGPLVPGYRILDMNSPYLPYLERQLDEVLETFGPVDGLFFDICWDQTSLSLYAIAAMKARGLDPTNEADRKAHAHHVALSWMRRFYDKVKRNNPAAGVHFNSRVLANLAEEIDLYTQVEIEALATGGWGYMYFPKNVRFARTFGKPYLGMTARFHKSWADFGGLKPYPALEFEVSQMLAHGAKCSIGDQLHPRGVPDAAAYELIGKIYARVAEREPWCEGATPVSQIGLFQVPPADPLAEGGIDEGATRVLTQLKHQFDVVDASSKLENYELLILPDVVRLDRDLLARVRAYLKRGGKLLATGTSGLTDDGTAALLPELAIKPEGLSPFTTTYMRLAAEAAVDAPPGDHVVYERGVRVTAGRGGRRVATVVEPYFERTYEHFMSHFQTPPDKPTKYAAAVLSGRTAYVAFPLFKSVAQHGSYVYRLLTRNLLNHLLPEPLIRVDATTGTEATVMRQRSAGVDRTIVHLLSYSAERRTPKLDLIEDVVPLFDVPLSLKLPRPPKQVYFAPDRKPIPFEYLRGRVNLRVPVISGHAMVVFE